MFCDYNIKQPRLSRTFRGLSYFLIFVSDGANNNNRLGKANSAIRKERIIITAVNTPKVENIGIGEKAITMKPTDVDRAVAKSARPVLWAVLDRAALLSRVFFSS